MNADDIPTEITKLTYDAPGPTMSQNDAAELLAHYWPAIEAHFLRKHADLLNARYGVANRAASDLRRKAELLAQQGH